MKTVLKIVGVLICVILLAAAGLIGYLTLTEFKPADSENVTIVKSLEVLEEPFDHQTGQFTVLSWNTGYGGLSQNADFFMDGGQDVRSCDEAQVRENIAGIQDTISRVKADFVLLQEVDSDSYRTYGIDEREAYPAADSAYALNYSCAFVPFPMPPIGRVHSGIYTLSNHRMNDGVRISLPCPFSWPVSTANLKRCVLITRVPLDGKDEELVLVNLHLEAYDSGEGKIAQTRLLWDILGSEYEKGNYVIAGGDFNQSFPGALDTYPIKNPDTWQPGILSEDDLLAGWQYAYDTAVPSCRLLNMPYDPDEGATQYYTIDGFIVSPNIAVDNVQTLDEQFRYTDHNPVLLTVSLK